MNRIRRKGIKREDKKRKYEWKRSERTDRNGQKRD